MNKLLVVLIAVVAVAVVQASVVKRQVDDIFVGDVFVDEEEDEQPEQPLARCLKGSNGEYEEVICSVLEVCTITCRVKLIIDNNKKITFDISTAMVSNRTTN